MKRFALFTGLRCYPSGGWDDLTSSFDTLEEAMEGRKFILANQDPLALGIDWSHIVDLHTGEMIDELEHEHD